MCTLALWMMHASLTGGKYLAPPHFCGIHFDEAVNVGVGTDTVHQLGADKLISLKWAMNCFPTYSSIHLAWIVLYMCT